MRDLARTVLMRRKFETESPIAVIYTIGFTIPTSPPTMMWLTNNTEAVPAGINPVSGAQIMAQPFPLAHGDIPANKVGDLRDFDIQLHDAGGEVLGYCAQHDWLTGQRVVITYLPVGVARQEASKVVHEGRIILFDYAEEVITFTIGHLNMTRVVFPPRRFDAHHCGVGRFGNVRCGYDIPAGATNAIGGGYDFCARTIEDCITRGLDEAARGLANKHPLRFDAFPGAAQSVI